MRRLSDVIEEAAEWPMYPLALTENSGNRAIRVAGVVALIVWFMPAAIAWIVLCGVLGIPAMIQDA